MNKNKFLIIFLGLAAIISVIIFTNKRPTITNNSNALLSLNRKNILLSSARSGDKLSNYTQKNFSTKVEELAQQSIEKGVETQVPWQELNEKWQEDLKSFLISLNERDGLRMFNAYVEARAKYLKEDARLGEKYQKIHSTKPLDKKKEDELAVESAAIFDQATKENKKILGQYYDAVKKLHKEFEDSIQVYSRDMPIALDFGFDN